MKYLPMIIAVALMVPLGSALALTLDAGADVRMCTMEYRPVCGAKEVQCVAAPCYPVYQTYGNSCTMGNDGATFIHEGECTESETGPVKPAPAPVTAEGETSISSDVNVSITSPATTTEATTTDEAPQEKGFFLSLWTKIVAWFDWF